MFDLFGNAAVTDTDGLGLPYRGSKRKYADSLICKMLEVKPHAKYFYDLFGGGGAMSFAALQKGMTVVYNEKQTDLVEFMGFILECIKQPKSKLGIFPEKYYKFVTRDEFIKLQDEPGVYAQFIRICYSFGNNQRSYMFNPELEKIKHLAHNIVVYQDKDALLSLNNTLDINITISNLSSVNERRLAFMAAVRKYKRIDLEQLQQLEQLQRLQQLEQLQRLQRDIKFINMDYKDVKIETPIEETIVYLDPPYRNTEKYIEGVDYNELDSFFLKLPYVAFMSEYNAPFKTIYEIATRSTLSSINNNTERTERLYINK